MTTWITPANGPLGQPTPGGVDATARVPVGSISKFFDSDGSGEGEFIYLPGTLNTVAGDVVDYDIVPGAQVTARHSNATASNSGRSIAVATAAAGAGTWAWYQISGVATVNAVAGTIAGAVMGTGTAGQIGNTADPGDQILGARVMTAVGTPATGKAYVSLNRPIVQGQIT